MKVTPRGDDQPDEDGDRFLDPAAGHGTFIAGVIEQIAPGCQIEAIDVLTSYGDGREVDIANRLLALAGVSEDGQVVDKAAAPPDLVNLSFGGYSPLSMLPLGYAVNRLREAGTVIVASAGNDASCAPMYPAAFPEVVGVGAIDDNGDAAPFTNYGPWVDACARGVDIVSLFFDGFDGDEPRVGGTDEDDFHGWARWSGTSFAAPKVVAELARLVQGGATGEEAVERLIRDPALNRKAMLGTVV